MLFRSPHVEKAYDSVSWQFLFYMMRRMGFHERWISWIKGCLTSASIYILVNGSPTTEFKPKKGLRQGDPLASFLFDLVDEGLIGLMREVITKNYFQSFLVGKNKVCYWLSNDIVGLVGNLAVLEWQS